jgi:hypothetical protein
MMIILIIIFLQELVLSTFNLLQSQICIVVFVLVGDRIKEAASTSETSVDFYQTTQPTVLEDSHLHTRRLENLKSHLREVLASAIRRRIRVNFVEENEEHSKRRPTFHLCSHCICTPLYGNERRVK